jgi:hypothetical protein
MGGSESKTAVNALSQAISNMAISTVQTCEVASTQDQNLTVNNSGFRFWGHYKLTQQTDIKSECFSDVSKQAELQNNIISIVSQSSSSSSIALLGAFGTSNAEASANLRNIVQNNVTMSNIQKSYSTIRQNQSVTFNNSGVIGFDDVELVQGAQLFAAATLQEIDKAGIFNSITTHVDQEASAKQENPLDFIAKIFGAVTDSITMTILFFIIIIAVAIFGFVYLMKAMGDSGVANKLPLPPPLRAAAIITSRK